jgi:hypothetical protein
LQNKLLLSFEVCNTGHCYEITVRVNHVGIRKLQSSLKWLRSLRETDHTHLMTPSWGGGGLTEDAGEDRIQVHHVKVVKLVY